MVLGEKRERPAPDELSSAPKRLEIDTSSLEEALTAAIHQNNIIEIKALIQEGANLAYISPKGNRGTFLHSATLFEQLATIKTLLEAGASPLVADQSTGCTIWHLAVETGNPEIMKYFITKKLPGINTRDLNGLTPLDYALRDQNEEMFLLLKDSPDIDDRSTQSFDQRITASTQEEAYESLTSSCVASPSFSVPPTATHTGANSPALAEHINKDTSRFSSLSDIHRTTGHTPPPSLESDGGRSNPVYNSSNFFNFDSLTIALQKLKAGGVPPPHTVADHSKAPTTRLLDGSIGTGKKYKTVS